MATNIIGFENISALIIGITIIAGKYANEMTKMSQWKKTIHPGHPKKPSR